MSGYVIASDFPINDDGLFVVMTRELIDAGFQIPSRTSYHDLGIPFAYPPLGFYIAGAVTTATGIDLIELFRWFRLALSVACLPAFALLAKELLEPSATRALISLSAVRYRPPMPLKLATILAHPDDETFGTGGTLVRYVREGIEVHSLCLTEGEKGWAGVDDAIVPRELVGPTRARELAEAGRRMGVASVTCLRYPDGALASVNADWVVRDIVRWLRRVRPEVVIIWGPDGGYGHPDHIAAGERALTAIELAGMQQHEPELGAHWHAKRCYRFVAAAELIDRLSSLMPAFAQYIQTLAVKPQRWTRDRLGAVVDVRDVLDAKVHAMEAHRTQAPDLAMWARARAEAPEVFTEETFIREFPEPGGSPLETDLFAGLRRD